MFGKSRKTLNSPISLRMRIVLALTVCGLAAAIVATMTTSAATPSSGTIDATIPMPVTSLFYTAGPFTQANATPIPQLDSGPRCNAQLPCDSYLLTVKLPAGYNAAHNNPAVKVTLSWVDAGSGNSDYDLWLYSGNVTTLTGNNAGIASSASSANPEIASIFPLVEGTATYTIKVVPYTPTGESIRVDIQLLDGNGGGGGGGPFGGPDPTVPGNPRYQNFYAPAATSAQAGSGEFNIGYNPMTRRIMTMNTGPIWRLTPGEAQATPKPECCEALWQDKSAASTNTGLDPILWTDGGYFGASGYLTKSGRTFASNSTAGANAVYAYSDNDGDLWVPIGAGLPNGGADHQTIGTGPFPSSLSALGTPQNFGQYALYCSQNLVGSTCQRSLTLGTSWEVGVPATGPGTMSSKGCGGLHGHARIAPDGTAVLPDKSCGGKAGGGFSLDSSTTPWTEFVVEKTVADVNGPAFTTVSQANGADPSIAFDAMNTAYYCYVNNENNSTEGHAHVAVGKRVGSTINWIRDTDIGATHGIVNAAHTEAIAGSAGRAACGFVGTNKPGNYQAGDYPGMNWYVFIATTYDEGVSWVTVNATPNDPVQHNTGIWQQGGSGSNGNRNLLDFNEITVDEKGRVLYGYSDGCVTAPCIALTQAMNDKTAYMRVARQFGGKTLNALLDPSEPSLPKPACLSGTRDSSASHLTWKAPDNAGSDIVGYQILRSTTTGTETVIVANTGNTKTTYDDTTALSTVPDYFYVVKAINGINTGTQSNEIDLTVGVTPPAESACVLPGLTILQDATGDALDMVAGHDVQKLSIAEPYAFAANKVVFTLKMASLAVVPPDTRWPVTFTAPNATNYTVRMTNSPADGATTGPIFQVGPTAGPFVAADAASNFNADGTITMVVPRSAIGNPAVGQNITGFLTRIAYNIVAATITPDNMPDSLAPTGSYTIVGNDPFCRPNTCPVPVINATPTMGNAPLLVNFDGSGSSDPDTAAPADTIASYTFDFGDGSPVVTRTVATFGAAAAMTSHTYNSPGGYAAKLTVTDSRGLVSCIMAPVSIEVASACTGTTNYALSANGSIAVASSSHSSGNYPTAAAINGDRKGATWGTVNGGWNDGTRATFPDNLEVDFGGAAKAISEIRVFTLQNNWKNNPGEPTATTSASGEGILDFDVQVWNGVDAWLTVAGGSVTGNDKAMRIFTFPAFTTTKFRVVVNNARNNYSRIVELEAYGACGQP
jgi:hypothetical protein